MQCKFWVYPVLMFGLLWSALASAEMVRFSVPEKAWLNDHQIMRVGVVEYPSPILFFSGGTNPQGLVADYLRALAMHLGVQIEMIRFADRAALSRALEQGEVDLIGAAVVGMDGSNTLIYTMPYLRLPIALFGRDSLMPGGVDGLQGKDIAGVDGDPWEDDVELLAPGASVKSYADLATALRAVAKGEVAAYLGEAASANYLLKREDFLDIEEQQRLELTYDIALATHLGRPELQSLLQKGLDRINQQELREIWRHWPGVERPESYSSGISKAFLWVLVAILWTVLVAWGVRRFIRRRVVSHDTKLKSTIHRLRRREKHLKGKLLVLKAKALSYRTEVRQQRQRLGLLDDVMPNGVWVWDPSQQLCQWDDAMHRLYQRLADEFEPSVDAILGCVHEEDRERVAALYHAQQAENETRLSYRIRLPDGGVRWLLDYSHYTGSETDGGQRVGICWDVSGYLMPIDSGNGEH